MAIESAQLDYWQESPYDTPSSPTEALLFLGLSEDNFVDKAVAFTNHRSQKNDTRLCVAADEYFETFANAVDFTLSEKNVDPETGATKTPGSRMNELNDLQKASYQSRTAGLKRVYGQLNIEKETLDSTSPRIVSNPDHNDLLIYREKALEAFSANLEKEVTRLLGDKRHSRGEDQLALQAIALLLNYSRSMQQKPSTAEKVRADRRKRLRKS